MNKDSVTKPNTMRLCSLSGKITQSPPTSQFREAGCMAAREWQPVGEQATKDNGKTPAFMPSIPSPLTHCTSAHARSSHRLLTPPSTACPSLSFACLSPTHSATPPAECPPCATPPQRVKIFHYHAPTETLSSLLSGYQSSSICHPVGSRMKDSS